MNDDMEGRLREALQRVVENEVPSPDLKASVESRIQGSVDRSRFLGLGRLGRIGWAPSPRLVYGALAATLVVVLIVAGQTAVRRSAGQHVVVGGGDSHGSGGRTTQGGTGPGTPTPAVTPDARTQSPQNPGGAPAPTRIPGSGPTALNTPKAQPGPPNPNGSPVKEPPPGQPAGGTTPSPSAIFTPSPSPTLSPSASPPPSPTSSPNGRTMTTIAGTGIAGFGGDGGQAARAQLNAPSGIAVDAQGNVYVSDNINERVRRVDHATGNISTIAGTGQATYSGDGGPATSAALNNPQGLALDSTGQFLYIADFSNERVRRLDLQTGIIETVAGTGVYGFSGDQGPALSADLAYPVGVAIDSSGNLFIADQRNQRVRRVNASGIITTIAGNGTTGYSGDGGPATNASFNFPVGVGVDGGGDVFVADQLNQRIRRIDATGTITTWAGNGTAGYAGDGGPATAAQLRGPTFLVSDSSGNLTVADQSNNAVRVISATGGHTITTLAGTGAPGFSGDGGPAASATLNGPDGVAVGADGYVYIADQLNDRVRRVSP